jgi:hypothetical protein
MDTELLTRTPVFLRTQKVFRRVGECWNKSEPIGVLKFTMAYENRLISNGAEAPWDLCVPSTLRNPMHAEPMLQGLRRQQELLRNIALTKQAVFGASAEQLKVVSDQFQKTIGPLLEWAKKPRVRSELFMYRRSITGDKFCKLVSKPIEALVEAMAIFAKFISPKRIVENTQRRAQIMSIRGLALSCAPNFTRISDIKSFSRLYREFA